MDIGSTNVASSSRAVKKKEWTPMFPVPSHLVESYQGVLPPEVTFRTAEPRKKWRIKVEKFKEHYFFTDGWNEFEEEVDLKSHELLMYRAASSSNRNGKKKEKRRTIGNAHGSADSSFNPNNISGVQRRSSFRKELMRYHQYRMDCPRKFVMANGKFESGQIKLKNSEGREWPVSVSYRGNNIFALCRGWFDFLKANNVIVGSTLLFVSSSSDTIDVKVVREGSDKQALFKYLKTVRARRRNLNNAGGHHTNVPSRSALNVNGENEDRLSASEEEMDLESEE